MANTFNSCNLYKPEGMTIYRMWQWTHCCQLKNVWFFKNKNNNNKENLFFQVKLFHFSEKNESNVKGESGLVLFPDYTDLLSKQNPNDELNVDWTSFLHVKELHAQDYFMKVVSLRATFLDTHFQRTVCGRAWESLRGPICFPSRLDCVVAWILIALWS